MGSRITALLDAIARACEPAPADIASSLQALPDPSVLPSPWEVWTLIGLVRHRERQHWVAEIIQTRLRGTLTDMAALGALARPEGVPQSGSLPGMPEWEYYFHGRGCCISHKVEGQAIDVDFHDNSAEYFDTFFYENYLESLRRPELPEQRLRELHPSARSVTIAVSDLIECGALTPLPGRETHPYRVADVVIDSSENIAAFCQAWADPTRRLWLASLIGDWPAAHEAAAGRPVLMALTAARAEECRKIRRQRLRQELGVESKSGDALQALADLGAPDLDRCLKDALSGRPSGRTSVALAIIERSNDPRWCDPVHALFSRLDPEAQLLQPYLWITSLGFLFRQGYHTRELSAAFPKAGGPVLGEAVLLALEYAPEQAFALIRKGLIEDIPANRSKIAAILALIDKPWSHRELLGALEASDNQEKTADARAALLELGDEDAQRAVLAWEERNPHEDEVGSYLEVGGRRLGPFYTFGEISLKNRASQIRYEMDKLHDRVNKVKNVIPPEPTVPQLWWRFWKK